MKFQTKRTANTAKQMKTNLNVKCRSLVSLRKIKSMKNATGKKNNPATEDNNKYCKGLPFISSAATA